MDRLAIAILIDQSGYIQSFLGGKKVRDENFQKGNFGFQPVIFRGLVLGRAIWLEGVRLDFGHW